MDLDLGRFVLKPRYGEFIIKNSLVLSRGGWVFIIELYFMDGETVRESFIVALLKWFY